MYPLSHSAIKGAFKMYRHIRSRSYLDARTMYAGGFYTDMTLREAQLIIGVMDKSDHAAIKTRHRVLMMSNHPDNAGSTYLATKIN